MLNANLEGIDLSGADHNLTPSFRITPDPRSPVHARRVIIDGDSGGRLFYFSYTGKTRNV